MFLHKILHILRLSALDLSLSLVCSFACFARLLVCLFCSFACLLVLLVCLFCLFCLFACFARLLVLLVLLAKRTLLNSRKWFCKRALQTLISTLAWVIYALFLKYFAWQIRPNLTFRGNWAEPSINHPPYYQKLKKNDSRVGRWYAILFLLSSVTVVTIRSLFIMAFRPVISVLSPIPWAS